MHLAVHPQYRDSSPLTNVCLVLSATRSGSFVCATRFPLGSGEGGTAAVAIVYRL